MLTVTITVCAPDWAALAVKEHLAMCLEPFGDVQVVRVQTGVTLPIPEQISFDKLE